jgi:amino-acid N-acetyltransferase
VKQAKEILAAATRFPDDVQIYMPHAVKACENGVKRAHLISRHVDGGL